VAARGRTASRSRACAVCSARSRISAPTRSAPRSPRGAALLRALPPWSCTRSARAARGRLWWPARCAALCARRRRGDDGAGDDGCGQAPHDAAVALCGRRGGGGFGAARVASVGCERAPARARGARGAGAAPNAVAGTGTPRVAITWTTLTSRPPYARAQSGRGARGRILPAPSPLGGGRDAESTSCRANRAGKPCAAVPADRTRSRTSLAPSWRPRARSRRSGSRTGQRLALGPERRQRGRRCSRALHVNLEGALRTSRRGAWLGRRSGRASRRSPRSLRRSAR